MVLVNRERIVVNKNGMRNYVGRMVVSVLMGLVLMVLDRFFEDVVKSNLLVMRMMSGKEVLKIF